MIRILQFIGHPVKFIGQLFDFIAGFYVQLVVEVAVSYDFCAVMEQVYGICNTICQLNTDKNNNGGSGCCDKN
ncbi:MAG: hypothetical protein PF495_20625 [Spirochaetales bacterium]|nr:hypothetical protein [Spirochaetales bacterium]